ncbi:MAG: hypothetical protein AAGC74_05000 [Verrucomicrobiota bacterium]
MTPDPEDAGSSLGKGFQNYLGARFQLLALETREALTHYKGKLLPALITLASALSAYLLILAGLVSLLGKLLASFGKHPLLSWEIPALALAALHIFVLLKMARRLQQTPSQPLFEYSRAEIEHDREWLQENKLKKNN